MLINGVNYEFDEVLQINRPTLYPGKSTKDWQLPKGMSEIFQKLNSNFV